MIAVVGMLSMYLFRWPVVVCYLSRVTRRGATNECKLIRRFEFRGMSYRVSVRFLVNLVTEYYWP